MKNIIYLFISLIFFYSDSFAYDADDRPGGSTSSSSTGGGSTSGRADRDQQGGGTTSGGSTSGRADRDQQGGGTTSSGSSSGGASSGGSSSGRADRDQQGGGSSSGGSSSGDDDDSNRGTVADAFSNQYGSSMPTSTGTNLSYGPNVRSSVGVSGVSSTRSSVEYSLGTTVSVNGTAVGAPEGGYDSRGNFYSTGRTVSSTGTTLVNSMLMGLSAMTGTTQMAQSFANGLQRVATSVGTSTARVAQQATRVISVGWAASTAGVVNMNNSIRGTIGAGSLGYQEAVEAAYYRGVENYYNANGVPTAARIVPTGPMARAYGMAAVAADPRMAAIDDAFNRGSVSVVSSRTGTSEQHMREFLGAELYDSLTDTQRLATQKTVLVAGTISGTSAAPILDEGTLGEFFADPRYTVVDVVSTEYGDTYSTTMRHELQHAGDWAAYDAAQDILDNPNSTARDRALANEVVNRLEPVVQQDLYRTVANAAGRALAGLTAAQQMQIANQFSYLSRLSELRAYSVDPTNMDSWATQYSNLTGVPVEEARQLIGRTSVEQLMNTPLSPENTLSRDIMSGRINP